MNKNKSGFGILVVLAVVSFLVITFLVFKTQYRQSSSTTSSPVPTVSKYSEVENFVKSSLCESLSLNWKSSVVAELVSLRNPDYITQDLSYGGQSFMVKHPKLGEFFLETSLVGDYVPEGVSGFDSILQTLIDSRKESFQAPSYYLDKKTHIIIGSNSVIVAKEGDPARWWMFSVTEQDASGSQDKVAQLTDSNDFKCLIRSVSFK